MTIHQVMKRQIGKQNRKGLAFCISLLQLLDTKNIEDEMLENFMHDFTDLAKKRNKYMLAAKSWKFCKRKTWEGLECLLLETEF